MTGIAMRAAGPLASIFVLIGLSSLLVRAADESPQERLPVPNSAAQAPIVSAIRSQYHDDYARRTAAEQLSLAENFRQQASIANKDPVRQYVLLREARELATNSGNLDAAFGIISETSKLFAIDGNELKVTAMANAMDRALIPKLELLENYLKVCDDSLSHGDLTIATHSNLLATQIARASRDPAVIAHARTYDLRVHDARREVTAVIAANEKLKGNPQDADSSLIVGRYVCFVQGNWEALTLLAQCSDPRLSELAKRDLDGPPTANAMADLADSWWDFPDSRQTPQKRSRQRAVYWYQKAIPGLDEGRNGRAKQRIREVNAGTQ